MRVLVCGGRNYDDVDRIGVVLNKLHDVKGIDVIIQGGARGADEISAAWGSFNGVTVQTYEADWEAFGSFAGPKRNQLMLDDGKPDLIIAFPGGKGTADMKRKARRAGVEVIEIDP